MAASIEAGCTSSRHHLDNERPSGHQTKARKFLKMEEESTSRAFPACLRGDFHISTNALSKFVGPIKYRQLALRGRTASPVGGNESKPSSPCSHNLYAPLIAFGCRIAMQIIFSRMQIACCACSKTQFVQYPSRTNSVSRVSRCSVGTPCCSSKNLSLTAPLQFQTIYNSGARPISRASHHYITLLTLSPSEHSPELSEVPFLVIALSSGAPSCYPTVSLVCETMADPLSIAGSIGGLVSVGDAVARLVFRYVIAVKEAQKEILELKTETDALTGVIYSLKRTVQVLEQDQRFAVTIRLDHVNSCLDLLHRMEKKLVKLDFSNDSKLRTHIRKLTWPYKSHETRALIDEIRTRRNTLACALSATSMDALLKSLSLQENVEGKLVAMHKLQTQIFLDEKRKEILKSFLFVDPKRNFDINLELRHPTTGFWLKENDSFKRWMGNVGGILWLSGIPGAGKTVLSTLIIEGCITNSSSDKAVAYFYCDYKDTRSQDPVHILGTLATQIARQSEDSYEILERYYIALHPEKQLESKPKADEFSQVIEQMASCFDDLRLIVDGLDECGDCTRAIAKLLRGLSRCSTSNIALALLSRNEPDISDVFSPPHSEHIEVAAHTEDVEHYVRTEIETRTEDRKLRIRNAALKEEVVSRLVAKAQGMFRWITCQLDYLCELVTDKQIRTALDELPSGLDATYRRLLERIKPRAIPVARKTLYWLLHSEVRLTIDELTEAVSVDLDSNSLDLESKVDEETIRLVCSSLLRKVNDTYLEIAHFTVKEYIASIDPNEEKIGVFSIDEARTRPILGRVCLAYLCMEDFNGPPPSSIEEFLAPEEAHSLYYHAANNWVDYLEDSLEEDQLFALAKRLFDPRKTYNFIRFCVSRCMRDYIVEDEDAYGRLVDIISSRNFQPLHIAADLHLRRICEFLLDEGCDVNQTSSLGTPLEFAIYKGWALYSQECSFDDIEHLWEQWSVVEDTVMLLLGRGAMCKENISTKELPPCRAIAEVGRKGKNVFQSLIYAGMRLQPDLPRWFNEYASEEGTWGLIDMLEGIDLSHENIDDDTRLAILDIVRDEDYHTAPKLRGMLVWRPSTMSEEAFLNMVCYAIQFDQPGELERLARDPRFSPTIQLPFGHGLPFHYALESGSLRALAALLTLPSGKESAMLKQSGRTVWHTAASSGDLGTLQLLVKEFGHDSSRAVALSDEGKTPLAEATWSGQESNAIYLLEWMKEWGFEEHIRKDPALARHCVSHGMVELLKQLSEFGTDTRAVLADGSNLLFYITSETPVELVKDLLSNGLDPRVIRDDGCTPLHSILRDDSDHLPNSCDLNNIDPEIFELITTPTVMQMSDEADHSPWYYFCTEFVQDPGNNKIIRVQVLQFAEPPRLNDLHPHTGHGVIHEICSCKAEDRIYALPKLSAVLQKGANPNLRTMTSRNTPFILAAKSGFLAAFEVLLQHHADSALTSSTGMNAVAVATAAARLDSLRAIRQLSCSVSWSSTFHFSLSRTKYSMFRNGYGGCNVIHCAATLSDPSILTFLAACPELYFNIHEPGAEGITPLHLAVEHGMILNARFLIENDAEVNAVFSTGKVTPLHLAILARYRDIVSLLFDAGAELLPDGYGNSSERLAQVTGDVMILSMVKEARSRIIERFQSMSHLQGELEHAITRGDVAACRAYVDKGILELGPLSCGCVPLTYALVLMRIDIAMLLVEKGASTTGQPCNAHLSTFLGVQITDPPKWSSAVHLVVHCPGFNAVLSNLLEKSMVFSNHWAWNPTGLFSIAVSQNPEAIDIIVKHIQDHWMWYRAFPPFTSTSSPQEVLGYFIDNRTFAPERSFFGDTPLMLAARQRKPSLVEKLLLHGASVHCRNIKQGIALHYAANSGCARSVKMLLEAGSDPNAQGDRLVTPLMVATYNRHFDAVSILVDRNRGINILNHRCESALHYAAAAGDPRIFALLLSRGLSPYQESIMGASPLLVGLLDVRLRGYICNSGLDLSTLPSRVGDWSNPLWVNRETNASTVRLLVRSLPNPILSNMLSFESKVYDDGELPLCNAARYGNTAVMEVLLNAGADIELASAWLGSPIIAAASAGYLEAVRMLARRGALIEPKTPRRFPTALHAALSASRKDIVDWFIKGRFTDQKRIDNFAQHPNQDIKSWSGIRYIGIPVDQAWRKRP
ncbi:hypothetical protein BDV96DRAFT_601378 [Lophiotrema nucula]|uniref:Ankyrin repeat-containing domain protein n=1 Tax=Lophiotrema nucula TaxID=690887 RepID=A0A6A5Z170_9PLEO|nr:hypothetical protein BDV96DRAFT_601378 [Lophiotrema nucula]